MSQFVEGDRVRVDIPAKSDPDHEQYHGWHGEIVDILEDDAGSLYRVELDRGDTADFRRHDLRPPIK